MNRRHWHFHTRQPGFIARSVLLVLLMGLAVAWMVGQHPQYPRLAAEGLTLPDDLDDEDDEDVESDESSAPLPSNLQTELLAALTPKLSEDSLILWLRGLRTHFHHLGWQEILPDNPVPDLPDDLWLHAVRKLSPAEIYALASKTIAQGNFLEPRKTLFQQATDALWLTNDPQATALTQLQTSLAPRAQELLGDYFTSVRDFSAAEDAYAREGAQPTGAAARPLALGLCISQKYTDRLRALRSLPGYAEAISKLPTSERSQAALLLGDYPWLLVLTAEDLWQEMLESPAEVCLTLVCGLIWWLLLHQLGGMAMRGSYLSIIAVALGCLSPIITLYILALQEQLLGLQQNGQVLNDLIYFMSGVGLREELSKLALFALLIPWLRRRADAEILVVAGCVGLGFAIEENVGYFGHGSHAVALGRCVTANFLHIGMTSLSGLALMRWLRYPRSLWEQSLLTIIGMVLLHGGYDFCLEMHEPSGVYSLQYASTLMLMGLAYFYIQELRRVRLARGNMAAPLWTFLVGVAVLAACSLVASSRLVGLELALVSLIGQGLSVALLVGLLAHQLRDL